MATQNSPPSLQIAQVLADLSDLNVADPPASLALVTAHLNLSSNEKRTQRSGKAQLHTSTSMSMDSSVQNQRRRGGITPAAASGTLYREDSSGSGIEAASSRYQTPSPGVELDPDLERARTLIQLYENRGRLKQQESGGLARARANVEAIAEKYNKGREGFGH